VKDITYWKKKALKAARLVQGRGGSSECIASSSFDPEIGELIIVFVKRGTYKYFDVEEDVFDALNGAASQGEFFNLMIRDSGYSYERIG